jgi:hypothetical protein
MRTNRFKVQTVRRALAVAIAAVAGGLVFRRTACRVQATPRVSRRVDFCLTFTPSP